MTSGCPRPATAPAGQVGARGALRVASAGVVPTAGWVLASPLRAMRATPGAH
ncbi:hypothetical protein [Saccharothrix algeriensis]|uniref:Uncharacterized protein n=1 Tax=Saccharothrix algeriensis TaxID=173560 RepID=A0ABS2S5Z0_9PSEU|nr:hypothetical protein [Saccharothrix algeriensis]MBM7810728.1 hypothetical protein [Saccharothrix algeriensis]